MPDEYLPYVYIFDDETVEGFSKKMQEILSLPMAKLKKKGEDAKQFVLSKKNNIFQAERIASFVFE